MLGIALIKQCIANNVRVIALVRQGTQRLDRLPDSKLITVIYCDLENLGNVIIDEKQIDVFYHIGWAFTDKTGRMSPDLQELNIRYTLDAVHLAKKLGCKRFIGTGSQAEYGRVNSVIKPDTPVNPDISYGIAKYAAGKLSRFECEILGIEHIWVRVFSVYGINDNNGTLLNSFISKVKQNKPMALTKCEQIWDYLYEDDAGNALFLLGSKGISGKVYCLGSGKGKPLIEYLEIIKKVLNPGYNLVVGELPYGSMQVMHLCADISELSNDTGWKPVISFEEGIRKIVQTEFLFK
jgi:nucleoside-diphosphate-sugar epimerase